MGPRQWAGGAGAALPLSPGYRAPRGGAAGAEELPTPGDAAPRSPAGAGGSAGRAGGPALTFTKSSMMGSLSSSFSPFSGIDNAMAGSMGLRGQR